MPARVVGQAGAQIFKLDDLVRLVQSGHVRVPHFQRDFRWAAPDVLRLFDSILQGYPIGSLLLWRREAPAGNVRIGAVAVKAPRVEQALWVVDGQQRITSIVNALDSAAASLDERFGLAYDLRSRKVVKKSEADSEQSVPLPVLFDLRQLLAWLQQRPDLADQVTEINDVASRVREFEVPAYIVDEADTKVLQEIFDRMNNSGKRLSRAEVFSALFAPDEALVDQSLTIANVAEIVAAESSFGRIDDDTVLRVILARRGPDIAREIRIEFEVERRNSTEFPNEDRDGAFRGAQIALQLAIGFLQRTAGVPHVSMLPYRYLVVVLARFFAHFPSPHPRNVEMLKWWFWRAALSGPELFKGGATGAMRALCTRVRPKDESGSLQSLLEAVSSSHPPLPDLSRFRTNEASTRIVLAAMWSHGPRSPLTGDVFDVGQLAQALSGKNTALDIVYEIERRQYAAAPMRAGAANRLLLLGVEDADAAVSALASGEVPLADEIRMRVLESHQLDVRATELYRAGQIDEFFHARQAMLENMLFEFVARNAGLGLELTPPLESLDLDEEDERDDFDGRYHEMRGVGST